MRTSVPKPPEILDKIVDLVLSHKPKSKRTKGDKSKKQKRRNLPLSRPPILR
jgi:hypothetical protein